MKSPLRIPLLALAALLAFSATRPAFAAPPRETIDQTATQVIEILKDKSLDTAARRRRVEDVSNQHFDFDVISRLALARNWATLSPEQQTRFIEEFRQHLSVTYGRNLDSYSNEKVVILGDREEQRGDWSVKTKIIDVTIESVSLVANFRSQFQEIMASGGADRLLTLLAEKNAKGESILPPKEHAPHKPVP